MPTIVISKRDVVARNVAELLLDKVKETDKTFNGYPVYEGDGFDMIIISSQHIYVEWISEAYPSDLYIFPSVHRSESGKRSLTVHPTGNFGDALLGGKGRTLSVAPALHMRSALLALFREKEEKDLDYSVSYEVTHHGPTISAPLFFIEVGSTEKEWNDEGALEAVTKAVLSAVKPSEGVPAIGFGGGHYAPDFTRYALKGYAFGHMAPKYAADFLDNAMVLQMIEKTRPRPKVALFSSLPAEKRKMVMNVLREEGIEVIK